VNTRRAIPIRKKITANDFYLLGTLFFHEIDMSSNLLSFQLFLLIFLYSESFLCFQFVLLAVIVAMAAAYPQGLDAPYKPAASYAAPAYKGLGYANGRAKIQVYRGPSKGYESGKEGFAPWGFYATQPEDIRTTVIKT
jgi:hypothetical protein